MRELHGIVFAGHHTTDLKRQALLFDNLYIWTLPKTNPFAPAQIPEAELDFLRSKQIVSSPPLHVAEACSKIGQEKFHYGLPIFRALHDRMPEHFKNATTLCYILDTLTRSMAAAFGTHENFDVVPICEIPLPHVFSPEHERHGLSNVAGVTIESLPAPSESCAWQDIVDFKAELKGKRWGLRRFLGNLATKRQTEAEISDEIEWMVNEYAKAMKIHNIKASQGVFEVYILPVIEIAEDLAKFNWSKIAKGALSVRKRQVELMEAEMKAPGRECAYVFDARKRFSADEDDAKVG